MAKNVKYELRKKKGKAEKAFIGQEYCYTVAKRLSNDKSRNIEGMCIHTTPREIIDLIPNDMDPDTKIIINVAADNLSLSCWEKIPVIQKR